MRAGNEEPPRVFLLDPDLLLRTRRSVFLGDERFQAADDRLLREADQALFSGPFSVVDKEELPPSGDKHDYTSMGPCWWPDPDRPDGLPYVHREGMVNPECQQDDRPRLETMCSAVSTLATAYFFSDHEDFAGHASLLLRTWFLDEATRMNPHLEYGQGIRGHCEGRGMGIIDTLQFSRLVDAVGLLGASPAWNREDQEKLEAWFARYLDWLLTSEHGREEARQPNYHGTWYDVQVASLAMFSRREEIARQVLAASAPGRIESQIDPLGRQLLELASSRSLDYSVMNLIGLFDLSDLSGLFDLDLWGFASGDGRSIEKAFYWLVENALEGDKWAYRQVSEFQQEKLIPLLRRATIRFCDPSCEERLRNLSGVEREADRIQLLYPLPQLSTAADK